jgi:hypothetical protein
VESILTRQEPPPGGDPMIVSHHYRFIFLKTGKTASTSLVEVFREIAAAKDELHLATAANRRKLLRKHGTLEGLSFAGNGRAQRAGYPKVFGLHPHAPARDVRDYLGADVFGRYTIITSERNPYDRQVSLYAHRLRKREVSDLSGFSRAMVSPLYNTLHYNRLHNWEIYTLDERVCADHIIRFEHLREDLDRVLAAIGVDATQFELPHRLRSPDRPRDYRHLYDERARETVGNWYRREIAHFGYQF